MLDRRPRIETWPSALRSAIQRHQSIPFKTGVSDCGIMAADCVLAMTGFNPLQGIRFATDAGCIRSLREAGYASALDLVERLFREIPPSQAMRGDLGFPAHVPSPLMSPAVIDGPNAFSKNPDGPVVIPRTLIVRAFAV